MSSTINEPRPEGHSGPPGGSDGPGGPRGPRGPGGPGNRPQLDQKWIDMDQYALSHLHPTTKPNSSALESALSYSTTQGLPSIYSPRAFGKFLALQAKLLNAKHALEVGTLGGYAAIWLATENPELRITTLEVDAHHAEVAKYNIANAGVSSRVDVRVGPALESIETLLQEIEEGKLPPLDLTFIDADKSNNWNYFDQAVKGSRKGAVVLVDNIVQGGAAAYPPEGHRRVGVEGARTAIENVGKDGRVDAVVMQTVGERNHDGFLFAVVL